MLRFMSIVSFLFVASVTGCGSETESTSQAICQRGDVCNANLPGGSVKECTEFFDTTLSKLTPTLRDQMEFEFEACLENPSCSAFIDCVNDVSDGEDEGSRMSSTADVAVTNL